MTECYKYSLGEDPHSWSNFVEIVPSHIDIHLRVDFGRKIFFGHVDYTVTALVDGVTNLVFDVKSLAIEDVILVSTEKQLLYTLPKSHPALGMALTIPLPEGIKKGDTHVIRIQYSTTPKSGAIQWFEPHQTSGKKHPYVYTQCQAILARTLVPCMDTPHVKTPYSIHITVPSPLVAVASGSPTSNNPTTHLDDGWLTYSYHQKLCIPSYLIALACGALQRRTIGPRSSVWTEAELMEAAVFEYSEHTEAFIKAAEGLLKDLPYVWGTYDLLVLPTAFPYGGMENPQLTFLNSSLLTGDHSLVDVVAHEISHSWSGNLVTNSTWKDFWLNEGFTMYLERLLLGKVIGGEEYRKFQLFLGFKELVRTVKDLLEDGLTEFTKLRPDLTGIDPDDAFSLVPYEKGCAFLLYLETLVGGPEVMTTWLNTFYVEHAGKTISSETVRDNFKQFFHKKIPSEVLSGINWEQWWYEPGMPPFNPSDLLTNEYSLACEKIFQKWISSPDGSDLSPNDITTFKPAQIMFCLDEVVTCSSMPLKHTVLEKMEHNYKFFGSKNVEISYRFIGICLKCKYLPVVPVVAEFLAAHGRGRYVKYLYNCLEEFDHGEAVGVWKKNCHRYHSVIVNAFAHKLGK